MGAPHRRRSQRQRDGLRPSYVYLTHTGLEIASAFALRLNPWQNIFPETFMQSKRAFLFALVLASALLSTATQAVAPMSKGQAPGFYQMMLGDFEVTALSDGTANFPVDKLLTHVTPAKVAADLKRVYLKEQPGTDHSFPPVSPPSTVLL